MTSKIAAEEASPISEVKNESNLMKEIDDDDDFEEFESSESEILRADAANPPPEGLNVWEDNWDDESAETDFSKQLKLVIFFLLLNSIHLMREFF